MNQIGPLVKVRWARGTDYDEVSRDNLWLQLTFVHKLSKQ